MIYGLLVRIYWQSYHTPFFYSITLKWLLESQISVVKLKSLKNLLKLLKMVIFGK